MFGHITNSLRNGWPALLALSIAAVTCLHPPEILERLQSLVFDSYQRHSPRPYNDELPVRVVAIDDASLREFGQWPWPRDRVARMIDLLQSSGARAIGLDIVFAEPDRNSPDQITAGLPLETRTAVQNAFGNTLISNDTIFAKSLAKSRSVLAQVLTADPTNAQNKSKASFAFVGDNPAAFAPYYSGAITPLGPLLESASGVGAVNITPENDTIVRRIPLVFSSALGLIPSLDLELLRVAQGADTIVVKSSNASGAQAFGQRTGLAAIKTGEIVVQTDGSGAVRPRFSNDPTVRHISAAAILHQDVALQSVRDKIVLIGTTAAGLNDTHATPLSGAVAGVDIHADLLESIFSGTSLDRPDFSPALEASIAIVLCALAGVMALWLSPLWGAFSALALAATTFAGSFWVYQNFDSLIDALLPSSFALIAFGGTALKKYWQVERQRRWVSAAFSRYVAPELVDRLAANPENLKLGGETRELTIMFCDVRDFTARAETMSAQAVVRFLNRLHTPFSRVILDSGGTIDKFLGDGLMAFWNAPLSVPDHAKCAAQAALEMVKICRNMDAELSKEAVAAGQPYLPLHIGIGLNTGTVFVGNMGSDQRFDYSIIGDAVNVAARLEAVTKTMHTPILLARSTADLCHDMDVRRVGGLTLKGRSDETDVYALFERF